MYRLCMPFLEMSYMYIKQKSFFVNVFSFYIYIYIQRRIQTKFGHSAFRKTGGCLGVVVL